jgi:hypothetical protein
VHICKSFACTHGTGERVWLRLLHALLLKPCAGKGVMKSDGKPRFTVDGKVGGCWNDSVHVIGCKGESCCMYACRVLSAALERLEFRLMFAAAAAAAAA